MPLAQQNQLDEQVRRMQPIVDHQLRRAAAAGSRTLTEPILLKPLIDKLTSALTKVYTSRGVGFYNRLDPELKLRADTGDLYELFGNLLDNAAKYGDEHIRISAHSEKNVLRIDVDDDRSEEHTSELQSLMRIS